MQKSDSFLYEVQHNLVRCNKHSKWNHRKFSGFKQKEVTCLHSINCRHSLLPFCLHKRCHFGAHMVLKSSAIVLLVVRNIWTKNLTCFSLTEKKKNKKQRDFWSSVSASLQRIHPETPAVQYEVVPNASIWIGFQLHWLSVAAHPG